VVSVTDPYGRILDFLDRSDPHSEAKMIELVSDVPVATAVCDVCSNVRLVVYPQLSKLPAVLPLWAPR
jgi:hypothetical protein